MTRLGELRQRIKTFFLHGLWEIDLAQLSPVKAFGVRQLRLISMVVHDFIADRCLLRASALTYTTLLSIIPLLALMFAVLKGFGVQNVLEPLILENLALGAEEVVSQLINYIDNTNVRRLGFVGLAVLLMTVLTLLSNIEKSFNYIWDVEETRPLLRRFSDYFSVVFIGPIFVFLAISMTSTLQSTAFMTSLEGQAYVGELVLSTFKILPYVGMWIAFTALYIFMPNCKVHYPAALVGGVFGGTLWQLAQWGYVHFQVGVSKYNAIYGTMAALPILMVWIYVSWLIVLLGLEMTFAWQNMRGVPSDIRGEKVNYASREMIALTVLLVVAEAFYRGDKSWDLKRLANELDLPPRLARTILSQLVRLGFVAEVRDGEYDQFAYQPGRAPENLPLTKILEGLKGDGVSFTKLSDTPERDVVRGIEERLENAGKQALEEMTLQDLVGQMLEKKERKEPVLGPGKTGVHEVK